MPFYTKTSIKIISLIMAQAFLVANVAYPAANLRVPMGIGIQRVEKASIKQNSVSGDIEERAKRLFHQDDILRSAPVFEDLPLVADTEKEGKCNLLDLIAWVRKNRVDIGGEKQKGTYSYSFILHALWEGNKIPREKREEWDFVVSAAEFFDGNRILQNIKPFTKVMDAIRWVRDIRAVVGTDIGLGYLITALWTGGRTPIGSLKKWQFYAGAAEFYDTTPLLQVAEPFYNVKDFIVWFGNNELALEDESLGYILQALWTNGKIPVDSLKKWQFQVGAATYALKQEKAILEELIRTWRKLNEKDGDKWKREKVEKNPMAIMEFMNLRVLIYLQDKGKAKEEQRVVSSKYAKLIMRFAMEFYGKTIFTLTKESDDIILLALARLRTETPLRETITIEDVLKETGLVASTLYRNDQMDNIRALLRSSTDVKILKAVADLQMNPPKEAITQFLISQRAVVDETTLADRKKANPLINNAVEMLIRTETDLRIFAAIMRLKAKSELLVVTRQAIADEAGLHRATILRRQKANAQIRDAIRLAVRSADDVKILNAIANLQKQMPLTDITKRGLARKAGVDRRLILSHLKHKPITEGKLRIKTSPEVYTALYAVFNPETPVYGVTVNIDRILNNAETLQQNL